MNKKVFRSNAFHVNKGVTFRLSITVFTYFQMIFVIYACNVVLAEDDCTIPKEKKFKDLNSRGKKSYPR